jgi:hypothetical protein
MTTEIDKEIEQVLAAQRDIKKRLRQLRQTEKLHDDFQTWRKMTELKEKIDKLIRQSGLPGRLQTLKKIAEFPKEYIYQHPNEPHKKSMTLDAPWVKSFLAKGGNENNLVSKADATRLGVLRRAMPTRKKKKQSNSDTDTSKKGSKSAASSAKGIV